MVEFRWIQISLFLILLLQFTAVTGQDQYITIRDVGSVALPCKNVIKGQNKCDGTTWLYSKTESSTAAELVALGQIGEQAKAKSDRLSVREDCSLVIKKVTVDDAGRYDCRQFNKSGQKQGPDHKVFLSVINIYNRKDADDTVTLSCTLLKYGFCNDTVEWLYEGNIDQLNKTKGSCFATATFKTSSVNQELFKCKVTERYGETRLCNFTPRSSCQNLGKSRETEKTTTVDKNDTPTNNDGNGTTKQTAKTTETEPRGDNNNLEWWWFVVVAVGLAVLLLIVVVAVRRKKKTKGRKTKRTDNGTVEAEDVAYASVSYIKKNDSKPRVQTHGDDDDDDAVTYSTVKTSSPSTGASTDPSNLYATVNKTNQ